MGLFCGGTGLLKNMELESDYLWLFCEHIFKETCTSTKEPHISAKELYESSKEPCSSAKETCTSGKEPHISAQTL